jgi:hypothetical protein
MIKEQQLLKILEENKSVQLILEKAGSLNMPNWYLGAGGIVQTIWNIKHGFNPENGIKDYDLVYCDINDVSSESEKTFKQKSEHIFKDIQLPVEITNEARVHLWYREEFGYTNDQPKYRSIEEAIRSWSIIPTAIGVRKNADGKLKIYAPFGLEDLFNLTVKVSSNPKITEVVYRKKTDRWIKIWPNLKIIPWGQE